MQRDYASLEKYVTTLKILGRVILSCQFKSGPGHQLADFTSESANLAHLFTLDQSSEKPPQNVLSDTKLTQNFGSVVAHG